MDNEREILKTRLRTEVMQLLTRAKNLLRVVRDPDFCVELRAKLSQIEPFLIDDTRRLKFDTLQAFQTILSKGVQKTLAKLVLERHNNRPSCETSTTEFAGPFTSSRRSTEERLALKYPRRKIGTSEANSSTSRDSGGSSSTSSDSPTRPNSPLFRRRHEVFPAQPSPATYAEHKRLMQSQQQPCQTVDRTVVVRKANMIVDSTATASNNAIMVKDTPSVNNFAESTTNSTGNVNVFVRISPEADKSMVTENNNSNQEYLAEPSSRVKDTSTHTCRDENTNNESSRCKNSKKSTSAQRTTTKKTNENLSKNQKVLKHADKTDGVERDLLKITSSSNSPKVQVMDAVDNVSGDVFGESSNKKRDNDGTIHENLVSKPSKPKSKGHSRELHDLLSYTEEIMPKILNRRKSGVVQLNAQIREEFNITKNAFIVLNKLKPEVVAHRTRSKSIDSAKFLVDNKTAKETIHERNRSTLVKTDQQKQKKSSDQKKSTEQHESSDQKKSSHQKKTPDDKKSAETIKYTDQKNSSASSTSKSNASVRLRQTARKSSSKPPPDIHKTKPVETNPVEATVTTVKEKERNGLLIIEKSRRRCRSPSPPSRRTRRRSTNSNFSKAYVEDIPIESSEETDDEHSNKKMSSISLKENPKPNNDPKVHCQSDYMEECCLCSYMGENMVQHYVYNHPKKALYVSRVAPEQAELIKADPLGIRGEKITRYSFGLGTQEVIKFRCFFCDLCISETQDLWIDHISGHTGEYRYKCVLCPTVARSSLERVTHHVACSNPSIQLWHKYAFESNHLYGYMCKKCNFVQVIYENIFRHLREDHAEDGTKQEHIMRFSLVNFGVQDSGNDEVGECIVKLEPMFDDTEQIVDDDVKREMELIFGEECKADQDVQLKMDCVEETFNIRTDAVAELEKIQQLPQRLQQSQVQCQIQHQQHLQKQQHQQQQQQQPQLQQDQQQQLSQSQKQQVQQHRLSQPQLQVQQLQMQQLQMQQLQMQQLQMQQLQQHQLSLPQLQQHQLSQPQLQQHQLSLPQLQQQQHQQQQHQQQQHQQHQQQQIQLHQQQLQQFQLQQVQFSQSQHPDQHHHLTMSAHIAAINGNDVNCNQVGDVNSSSKIRIKRLPGDMLSIAKENTLPVARSNGPISSDQHSSVRVHQNTTISATTDTVGASRLAIEECISHGQTSEPIVTTSTVNSLVASTQPRILNGINVNSRAPQTMPVFTPTTNNMFIRLPKALAQQYHTNCTPSITPQSVSMATLKPWNGRCNAGNLSFHKLTREYLIAEFKCTVYDCGFYSDSSKEIESHFKTHQQQYSDLTLHQPASYSFLPWLVCWYCKYVSPTTASLLAHVRIAHRYCGYQCDSCCYRSRDPSNVAVHQQKYHNERIANAKILCIAGRQKPYSNVEDETMRNEMKANVKALQCAHCFTKKFIDLKDFITHIIGHKRTYSQCHICSQYAPTQSMREHLQLHNIFLFQCLYCEHGSPSMALIMEHVADEHPQRMLFYHTRISRNNFPRFVAATLKIPKERYEIVHPQRSVNVVQN